jgi:hypothetical protein
VSVCDWLRLPLVLHARSNLQQQTIHAPSNMVCTVLIALAAVAAPRAWAHLMLAGSCSAHLLAQHLRGLTLKTCASALGTRPACLSVPCMV